VLRENARGVAYYALFRFWGTAEDRAAARPRNLRLVARVVEKTTLLGDMEPPPAPEDMTAQVNSEGAQDFD